MLTYFLYGLFILSCLVLVVAVLLQPGKADAGALFTSSVSSTAFGPRGTQTILAKITIVAAALFMLVALTLSLPIVTGSRSVVSGDAETTTEQPAPAAPAAPDGSTTTAPAGTTTQTPGTGGEATPAANTNAAGNDTNANSNAQPAASPQPSK
ncbi:MAG TPA: preprotein translocase subunit SecG [Pyrinomonadaceae bacterium]|nr:preprotein translocase subunit SecG [Pyrinomonadaceae bacterium]